MSDAPEKGRGHRAGSAATDLPGTNHAWTGDGSLGPCSAAPKYLSEKWSRPRLLICRITAVWALYLDNSCAYINSEASINSRFSINGEASTKAAPSADLRGGAVGGAVRCDRGAAEERKRPAGAEGEAAGRPPAERHGGAERCGRGRGAEAVPSAGWRDVAAALDAEEGQTHE